jgi:hypothetical protein
MIFNIRIVNESSYGTVGTVPTSRKLSTKYLPTLDCMKLGDLTIAIAEYLPTVGGTGKQGGHSSRVI